LPDVSAEQGKPQDRAVRRAPFVSRLYPDVAG